MDFCKHVRFRTLRVLWQAGFWGLTWRAALLSVLRDQAKRDIRKLPALARWIVGRLEVADHEELLFPT